MKRLIYLHIILILWPACILQAQRTVYTDSIRSFLNGTDYCQIFIDSLGQANEQNILLQPFAPLNSFAAREKIPLKLVDKDFYLRFSYYNASDTARLYYIYPGKLFRQFTLYRIDHNKPVLLHSEGAMSGFIPVSIPPKTTFSLLLKAKFFFLKWNNIQFTSIDGQHLQAYQNRMYYNVTPKKTIGIILSGMLLMMIIVAILNYVISRRIEFLFNSLYSVCMFFLIFLTSYLSYRPGWLKGFFISYFDLFLLLTGIIFYIEFTRHFLESATRYPRLNKLFKAEVWGLFVLLCFYTLIHFAFNNYVLEIWTEVIIKTAAIACALFYIFLAFIQKNRLTKYLAIGLAIQIFFYGISLLLSLSPRAGDGIFTSPFVYFQFGVIISVLFFLVGLFIKTKQELIQNIQAQEALKIAAEKQRYEAKLSIYKAQQEERNRISADMHDELGAGMTSIRLFSELAMSKMGEKVTPEIEKISSSANELINKMNAIIWSMSSENDSLGNMVAYIRSYFKEYLENTGIMHRIVIPENLPDIQVPGTVRRNVFLVIKEALQNIVKHSCAKNVHIEMFQHPDALSLTIYDDGKGIDFDKLRPFSNGLTIMRKRMESVGMEFKIENKNGTKITLYSKMRKSALPK